MVSAHEPSQFALAAEHLEAFFGEQIKAPAEDFAEIILPGWRYDELSEAVLKMYEEADARVMPLDVFTIANAIGCPPIPYRAMERKIHDVLLKVSEDAVTIRLLGITKPLILFNDRQPPTRINFSIMHELGHYYAGHLEHSRLAEKEANYFAGVALCPVDLLAHYGITSSKAVCQLFNVSDDVAWNRLQTVRRRRCARQSESELRFCSAVIERFHFKDSYQMELFSEAM